MGNLVAPCKGCTFETGRSVEPNCHSVCQKYLDFVKKCDERRNIIREAKKYEGITYPTQPKKRFRKRKIK